MNRVINAAFGGFCASILIWGAASAAPTTDEGATRVAVSYGDLDLSHAPGADSLRHRVERAADQVCGGRPGERSLAELADFQACHRPAITEAMAQVDRAIARARSSALAAR